MWYIIIFSFIFITFIAYLWVEGITHMMDNHPDYKGEDLFDEEPKKKD
jgi:hypothetical protein